jgi:hypothetical protein
MTAQKQCTAGTIRYANGCEIENPPQERCYNCNYWKESAQQPQREYIITDEELKNITRYLNNTWNEIFQARVVWAVCNVRSRPHTQAPMLALDESEIRAVVRTATLATRESTLLDVISLLDTRSSAYTRVNLMLAKCRLDKRQSADNSREG